MTEPAAASQAHVLIRGRVQGVYFRGTMQQQATMRRVTGWVRNLTDGSVEAVIQGPREILDSLIAWSRHGPRGAAVESVDVTWSDSSEIFPTFEVRG